MKAAVRPGVSTGELDAVAEDHIRSQGAVPNFLGYHGFTGTICASINHEIVHGIPEPGADGWPPATTSPSTAGPSCKAGTATRPSR